LELTFIEYFPRLENEIALIDCFVKVAFFSKEGKLLFTKIANWGGCSGIDAKRNTCRFAMSLRFC
jgi:hypothetical protein